MNIEKEIVAGVTKIAPFFGQRRNFWLTLWNGVQLQIKLDQYNKANVFVWECKNCIWNTTKIAVVEKIHTNPQIVTITE